MKAWPGPMAVTTPSSVTVATLASDELNERQQDSVSSRSLPSGKTPETMTRCSSPRASKKMPDAWAHRLRGMSGLSTGHRNVNVKGLAGSNYSSVRWADDGDIARGLLPGNSLLTRRRMFPITALWKNEKRKQENRVK